MQPVPPPEEALVPRPRVGVVGGGLAGVATAWLLDGEFDVVLLEALPRLGGHAHTVPVEVRGVRVSVDLGAQMFSPMVHPTFWRLVQLLGVDDLVTRSVGVTVTEHGADRPRFVSPMFNERLWPLWTPWNAPGQLAFYAFARAAREFERSGDWAIPFDDWLRGVPLLTEDGRERIVLPWLAAMTGCCLADARTLSARAAVAVAARSLPDRLTSPYRWTHSLRGLGGVLQDLAGLCRTLTVRTGDPVTAVERTPRGFGLHAASGRVEEVDHAVLAAPPHALAPMLGAYPRMADLLRELPTFRSRLAIHSDPAYLPADRRLWSGYTTVTTGGWSEGTLWYGAFRDPLPDGGTLDLFKSWATARPYEPRELLHEEAFVHPLITPGSIAARSRLDALQGTDGLWFAGSWTIDVDLQETALQSALRVARALAPRGTANLARLQLS